MTDVNKRCRTVDIELQCQKLKSFQRASKDIILPEDYKINITSNIVDSKSFDDVNPEDIAWCMCRMNLEHLPEKLDSLTTQIIPTWSAFNSIIISDERPKHIAGYLPVLPHPVTKDATVYTALCNYKIVLSSLDQTHLPVYCDEGVYHTA